MGTTYSARKIMVYFHDGRDYDLFYLKPIGEHKYVILEDNDGSKNLIETTNDSGCLLQLVYLLDDNRVLVKGERRFDTPYLYKSMEEYANDAFYPVVAFGICDDSRVEFSLKDLFEADEHFRTLDDLIHETSLTEKEIEEIKQSKWYDKDKYGAFDDDDDDDDE